MKFKPGDLITKRPNALFPPDRVLEAYDDKYEIQFSLSNGGFVLKIKSAEVIDGEYVKVDRSL